MDTFSQTSYNDNTTGFYSSVLFDNLVKSVGKTLLNMAPTTKIAFAVITTQPQKTSTRLTELTGSVEGFKDYYYRVYAGVPCHGALKDPRNAGAVAVLTRLNDYNIGKVLLAPTTVTCFLNYLTCVSPYHRAFLSKPPVPKILQQGYIVCRTDVRDTVLLAACIASRRVWQYKPTLIRLWEQLVGLSPTGVSVEQWKNIAFFIICTLVAREHDVIPLIYTDDYSDAALLRIECSMNYAGFSSFIKGEIPIRDNRKVWYFNRQVCPDVVKMWKVKNACSLVFEKELAQFRDECFEELIVKSKSKFNGLPFFRTCRSITKVNLNRFATKLLSYSRKTCEEKIKRRIRISTAGR